MLAWDSAFWQIRVGRVTAPRLAPRDAERIDAWCRRHEVTCLYFLAASDDRETTLEAERAGFSLVDVKVTLKLDRPLLAGADRPGPADVAIRTCVADDLPALESIAASSHRDSRFYFDGRFPRERCDALFATWIRTSFEGWADVVLVAVVDERPVGYVTCHLDTPATGRIGLIGVGDGARGRGAGRALVQSAIDWCGGHGAESLSVVTQSRNVQAQRLYQRCGFVTASVAHQYHRWLDEDPVSGPDARSRT
jgi:dTDP-4-amino-4,6-dideoxy-D-galactose acyltransferase